MLGFLCLQVLEVDCVSLGSPERKALMHQPGLGEDLSRR